jgi:CDP-glycerol glycerophosphotransferase (TagB/SpsB family)
MVTKHTVIIVDLHYVSSEKINNNGLLTEREVCTVKYQTEVF